MTRPGGGRRCASQCAVAVRWLVRSSSRIRSMIPVNGPSFGRLGGALRRYPGGTENDSILRTVLRESTTKHPRGLAGAHPLDTTRPPNHVRTTPPDTSPPPCRAQSNPDQKAIRGPHFGPPQPDRGGALPRGGLLRRRSQNRTVERRRGPMGSTNDFGGDAPELMPRGLRGWIAKRFATNGHRSLQCNSGIGRGFTTVQRATRRLAA